VVTKIDEKYQNSIPKSWLKVPTDPPLSIREWARRSGMKKFTFTISELILRLDPETVVFDSGELSPSTVTGSAKVAINSAGFFFYSREWPRNR